MRDTCRARSSLACAEPALSLLCEHPSLLSSPSAYYVHIRDAHRVKLWVRTIASTRSAAPDLLRLAFSIKGWPTRRVAHPLTQASATAVTKSLFSLFGKRLTVGHACDTRTRNSFGVSTLHTLGTAFDSGGELRWVPYRPCMSFFHIHMSERASAELA